MRCRNSARGFTMVEFLVGVTVFLVITGAAVSLYVRHMPLYSRQQDLSALNVGLRNAAAQLQIDLANAGTGMYAGVNVAHWPIGITVVNQRPSGTCYDGATNSYSAECFDTLHVIAADPNVPPVHPEDIGTNCVSTTSSIAFAEPPPGMTPAQAAAGYRNGDALLFLRGDGSQMTVAMMTQDGDVSGNKIRLQHNPTGADGVNSFDPWGITMQPSNKLGDTYCTTDWVLKLTPISYSVDASDPENPVLLRWRNNTSEVMAEQIIGFKVGVTLWNGVSTSSEAYNFDAESYTRDFTRIRSVRVSLIGRTRPNRDPNYRYRNSFDGGPYQIQGLSVVVNPRNLSMND